MRPHNSPYSAVNSPPCLAAETPVLSFDRAIRIGWLMLVSSGLHSSVYYVDTNECRPTSAFFPFYILIDHSPYGNMPTGSLGATIPAQP